MCSQKWLVVCLLLIGISTSAQAITSDKPSDHTPPRATPEFIFDTQTGVRLTLEDFARRQAEAGKILIFGEEHAVKGNEDDPSTIVHHENQVRLLEALTALASSRNYHVTTAMEFLTYPVQGSVDLYVSGQLSEEDFLQQSGWSQGNPFLFYRRQILIPAQSQGRTLALNIPRSISGHVAQGGPNSLTAEERELLPPLWEQGSAPYLARFKEMTGGHLPSQDVENYFWAQSLWDDTMAWKTLENWRRDPLALTVIIVGGFHVEFGQGLKARIFRHEPSLQPNQVKTLLQIETDRFDEASLVKLLAPDSTYGAHADYLWVHGL